MCTSLFAICFRFGSKRTQLLFLSTGQIFWEGSSWGSERHGEYLVAKNTNKNLAARNTNKRLVARVAWVVRVARVATARVARVKRNLMNFQI